MLEIVIPENKFLNTITYEIITIEKTKLQLEHSLLSISKWESKYEKSYFGDGLEKMVMTEDEFRDYVMCMTLTKNVKPEVYFGLTRKHHDEINSYINARMTATTFSDKQPSGPNKKITAEIIYWQMINLGIPFECQKWHLNRLLTLIRVCSIKQQPPEKVPHNEMIAQRKALNAQRKAARRSRG